MSFFYDLNKRLAALATKQEQQQIAESKKAEAVAQSPLTQALNEGKRLPDIRLTDKNAGISQKDVDKHYSGSTIRMAQDLHDRGFSSARIAQTMHDLKHGTKAKDIEETDYSAKKAAAGKDIGKPGKNFSKIAKSAGARYGSKAAGERVAGAVLNKLRHAKEDVTDEGNAFTGKLKSTPKGSKFELGGKTVTDTSDLDETMTRQHFRHTADLLKNIEDPAKRKELAHHHAGIFKASNPRFDLSKFLKAAGVVDEAENLGLGEEAMDEGYAEMDAWLKSREKEKGTGKFDKKKISTGTVYTRKPEPESDEEEVSTEPKRRGRPMGKPKGPERVTAKSYKYKAGRPAKTNEGDMEGSQDHDEAGEYGAEGDYVKNELHTMVRVARDLEKHLRDNEDLPTWCIGKLSQAKGMVVSVMDYIMSEKERGAEQTTGREGITLEKAPPGAKAERMVKHIKQAYSKDGKLTPKEKAIAYATTWKAKKAGKVEEEGNKPDFLDVDKDGNKKETFKKAVADKQDNHAEKAGKKVTKDIEYDKKHKGKDDNKAEKAGKKVTKDIEYDEKVDETTTSGSVATAPAVAKSSKGMQFGKGVYESLDAKLENMISEGMNVTVNMNSDAEGDAQKSITVTATGEDADKLAELLKMAGLESKQEVCPGCGSADCGCDDEDLDENSLDWPTKKETLAAEPNLRTYSGGLNGPKSTGQTTIPVVASQLRRQVSMEENVELERNLFKTWTNYKG